MLIVAVTMLISVMGMHGSQTAEHLLDRFVQASPGVLVLFTLSPHVPILLGLIFLAWPRPGQGMLHGSHPSFFYKYALSVRLALVAGALST